MYEEYLKTNVCFFFFKQKTAYDIVSRDWSSDVCSSDPVDDFYRDCGFECIG